MSESDSSLLLSITVALPRFPFLAAVSFFGAAAAFAFTVLADFFAGSFAYTVTKQSSESSYTGDWNTTRAFAMAEKQKSRDEL